MQIEIISHCLANERPHYAGALCYQLSSLLLDTPKMCTVKATIITTWDDELTQNTFTWFIKHTPIRARLIVLHKTQCTRRSIGRNNAALSSTGDIVWFADVDQVYRDRILDRLADTPWPPDSVMLFPKQIMIHKDHTTGQAATDKVNHQPAVVDIDPGDFKPKIYHRAIGGVQIVQGDFTRRYGYLNNHSVWQKPHESGKQLKNFHDDRQYRGFCEKHGMIKGIDLPGMYRIRHTSSSYK